MELHQDYAGQRETVQVCSHSRVSKTSDKRLLLRQRRSRPGVHILLSNGNKSQKKKQQQQQQ